MSARTALVALAATLAIQIFVSLAASAPAVLAPILAADLGITAKWIGVFVGLVYAGGMLGSLAGGGFIARFGAIRVSQIGVLLCAVGAGLMALLPAAAAPLMVGAAVLIGIGYGPITPASSEVLVRTTPPTRMALIFSIKQTGVPAGAALAGALLPGAALVAGWRGTLLAVAAVGIVVVVATQSTRRALDTHHQPGLAFSLTHVWRPLQIVLHTPALRELSLVGFALAAVQVCLTSFLVVYLSEALQWSLVLSGLALTCASVSAVAGRIFWGMIADRALAPRRVLALIGILAGACGLAMAFANPAWPVALVLSLAGLYGATAIGWNGVQLAELARHAPKGSAGAITGASGFVTFGGVMVGPPIFAALAGATASYRTGFFVCAAVSVIAAAILVAQRPRGAAT